MSAGTCEASHSYPTAGSYTLAVTVIDDDGGTTTETFEHVQVGPASRADCDDGAWADHGFRNGGQCVRSVSGHGSP